MKANKNEVWSEFCDLLAICESQYAKHVAVACLLSYLMDDEGIDNACLIDSINKAKKSLDGSMRKPCRSVGMSGRIEQM